MNNDNTTFELDICWDDYASPWAALVALWEDFDSHEDILSVEFLGDIGMWPTFKITTGTVETARNIIANYLDVPDPFDPEVTEYLDCAN
jgi:hypothetical protein